MADAVQGVLCVGLRGGLRNNTIAPRLILADGAVTVAEALTNREETPATLGQRITYLAGIVGPGVWDVDLCDDGVPIVGSALTGPEVPAFAVRVMTDKGWAAPDTGAPAKRRRA